MKDKKITKEDLFKFIRYPSERKYLTDETVEIIDRIMSENDLKVSHIRKLVPPSCLEFNFITREEIFSEYGKIEFRLNYGYFEFTSEPSEAHFLTYSLKTGELIEKIKYPIN